MNSHDSWLVAARCNTTVASWEQDAVRSTLRGLQTYQTPVIHTEVAEAVGRATTPFAILACWAIAPTIRVCLIAIQFVVTTGGTLDCKHSSDTAQMGEQMRVHVY